MPSGWQMFHTIASEKKKGFKLKENEWVLLTIKR